MEFIPDYEYVFRLPTGLIRVVVVSDVSEELDPSVRIQTRVGEWVNLLVMAASSSVSDFEDDDPSAVVRSLVAATRRYFSSQPSSEALTQFHNGLLGWVSEHRRVAAEAAHQQD